MCDEYSVRWSVRLLCYNVTRHHRGAVSTEKNGGYDNTDY